MSLLIIISSTFMHWLAIYGSRPYISLLAVTCGAGNVGVGLIAALYSLIQVACALKVSGSIDRFGARKNIVAGNMFLIIGLAGLGFTTNLWFIAVCSLSLGLSHVLVMVSAQYLATGFSGKISKERAVGYYTFGNSAGIFVGPGVGAALHTAWGINAGFWGTCIIAVVSLVFAWFIRDLPPESRQAPSLTVRELLQDKTVLRILLLSSMVLFCSEITVTYFPVYGAQIGLSITRIGTVLSVSGCAMMAIRPFLSRITSRFPMRAVLVFCLIVGGVGMAGYGLMKTYHLLIATAAVSGLTLGLLGPLTIIAATDATDQACRSKVLAIRTMINFFGQGISPVVFGALSVYVGLSPIFLIGGAAMALGSRLARTPGKQEKAV